MAVLTPILSILFLLLIQVAANTEKTVFLGPKPARLPTTAYHFLSDLRLDTLTSTNGTLRTRLAAMFPTDSNPLGAATWFILDNLTPDQRYEVRVCWAATQPTEFALSTFKLDTVRDTPELLASLRAGHTPAAAASEATTPEEKEEAAASAGAGAGAGAPSSALLLRILAAADYFTTDASLMRDVPPVDVDIILDPFLFNVLPRSIAGTACYIVGVAVAAYFLASQIAAWIQGLIAAAREQQEGEKKRQ